MAKDYTDYVALVLEAEKRVFHIYHYTAKEANDFEDIEHNGRKYVFDKDRAFRVKWAPWRKFDKKKPWRYLYEVFRSKKVGLLLYHEPLPSQPLYREVQHRTPKEYVCKTCGFTTVHPGGIKMHMTRRHKLKKYGAQIRVAFDTQVEKIPYYKPVQPIHISRMHQPSGEMRE